MPDRSRRKSVVDMLAKVPVHRGSLLRSLDDLLKTIEISESTVMIPTLMRDKCQFDAWELLFVAKILKASILGHSDLVEFYMNHMGNQASIQQHQHELNRANSSSHEQLIRVKTGSSSSNLSQIANNNNLQAAQSNQTPNNNNSDILTNVENDLAPKTDSILTNGNSNHSKLSAASPSTVNEQYHSARSSTSSNGITSWISDSVKSSTGTNTNEMTIEDDDNDATPTPTNTKTDSPNHHPLQRDLTLPSDAANNNHSSGSDNNTTTPSSCHSIIESTEESSDEHKPTTTQQQQQQLSSPSSPLLQQIPAAKPPNRLFLPPTPSSPHDSQVNCNHPHSGLAESPMSLSQNNIEQLESRLDNNNAVQQAINSNMVNNIINNASKTILSPSSTLGSFPARNQDSSGAGVTTPLSTTPSSSAMHISSLGVEAPPFRNCRSTSSLSRINSGASSPHGNNTAATTNGLHPATPTTPVARSLAAALNGVGSDPVADPASAPVKLLLQIEQLKTSINQVRNLLESVVELYKNSIDNLAVQ